ncbi:serine/threonine protein kinase [Streptomyces sp. AC536]|uniref:serine/threonine-protein kinase n=1 Tax=Streptomyces buecherae TaxID=2763006 RepID=UPI00164E810E|nr:serine/threonine-protein kinase [Streptomyces buecherae]MBC3983390.1 serine/threonine protein kinase [Streptomyces buecherae]QNJ40775.1 serine/threonine protein kinase [Streptomyces buecherae]
MYPLEPDDPRRIGAYRLLRRLGSGGMGRVYLGRSAGGRTVAVKLVHPHFATDAQFRARFRREVEAARRVGGAWTAPVLDADPEAAVPWVATGYVAGPSLTQAVEDLGALPAPCVRALGASLAEALVAVHGLGLVHRDVKPSNVLLALDGPRLIDFGITRAIDGTASLTSTGVSIGSPGYMSPEQILGQGATAAADVFSLGAVLAYAATGRPPFPGDSSAALLYRVVHEQPELGPSLAGELRAIVADCLVKDPTGRPTPAELVRRLTADAGGDTGADTDTGAGGGAAGLVRPGWLPAPLVEGASRRAMELLDLEAEPLESAPFPSPAPTPPPASAWPAAGSAGAGPPPGGPTTLSPQALGPETVGMDSGVRAGAFGPPDPSYGGRAGGTGHASQPQHPSGVSHPSGAGQSSHAGAAAPVAAPRRSPEGGGAAVAEAATAGAGRVDGAVTGDAGEGAPRRPGGAPGAPGGGPHGPEGDADGEDRAGRERRMALSAGLGRRGRPRWLSCSLVLSVAGALAVATTAVVVYDAMRGGGGGDTHAGGDKQSQSPSPHSSATTPAPDGSHPAGGEPTGPGTGAPGGGAVPKDLIGTWKGPQYAKGKYNGEHIATVRQGRTGTVVVEAVTDVFGQRCYAKGTLRSVTERNTRLTITEATDESKEGGSFLCTGVTAQATYTLDRESGKLVYKSQDEAAGRPVARMVKQPAAG